MANPPPDRGIRTAGLIDIKSGTYARGIRVQIFLDPRVLTKRGGAADITSALYDHLLHLGCSPEGWSPAPPPPKQHYLISFAWSQNERGLDVKLCSGWVTTTMTPAEWLLASQHRIITNVLRVSPAQAELLRGDPAMGEG
jgi:hypothetical protein